MTLNPVIHLEDHPDGAGYFFFDETWSNLIGPHSSKIEATAALGNYGQVLDQGPSVEKDDAETEFWLTQFEEASAGEVIQPLATEEQRDIAWNKNLIAKPKTLIKLDTKDNLIELEGLIDGGYMSFVYGSRKENFGGWHTAKFKYSNFLMLLDSGGMREKEYPPYKSRRNERREKYPHMMETYEKVKAFRIMLRDDPMVRTASIVGYEADDLIAILFLKGIGLKLVIAQDKDFFMIRGLRAAMTDHQGTPQSHRDLKLPKYAIPPNNPGSWVLTQAIFGDKSDSIPRLLPSRVGYRDVYNACVKYAPNLLTAYWNCAAQFGDQFIINIKMVLLPHYSLSKVNYDSHVPLIGDLCNGSYWDPENFSDDLLDTIVESTKKVVWDW